MSPGLIAFPPGMFSVVGMTAMQRTGAFSREMAAMAQTTAAPPDMSSFILSMFSAGLIEMPPVSNVMPLPTSPRTVPFTACFGSCRRTITRGGSGLPRATPSSMPIFRSAIRCSSRTSTCRPAALAIFAARSANTRGVRLLPGSLASSRAMFDDSPRIWPRSAACSIAAVEPPTCNSTRSSHTVG